MFVTLRWGWGGVSLLGGLRDEEKSPKARLMDKLPSAWCPERRDMERLGDWRCVGAHTCRQYWEYVERKDDCYIDRGHRWGRSNCVVSVRVRKILLSGDSELGEVSVQLW